MASLHPLGTILFTVGFALEVAGAILLARGIWLKPKHILRLSWAVFGPHPGTIAGYIESKIDGSVGIAGLIIGFAFQTLSFLLLSLDSSQASYGELGLAVAIGLAAVGIFLVIWRISRRPLARRMALAIVRCYDKEDLHSRPNLLVAIGDSLGWIYDPPQGLDGPRTAELREEYIVKTFGLSTEVLNRS